MTKMINRRTGGIMYVSAERVEDYKAHGHKVAADEPKKTTRKRKETKK